MGLGKKTIKLVTKVLSSDKKRKLYTPEEIMYMERRLKLLKEERSRRLEQRKREKGFSDE